RRHTRFSRDWSSDVCSSDLFYQKDNEGILPPWIDTYRIDSRSSEKTIEYMLCQNEATLLYMANLGCIEINPWSSRIESLDNPDRSEERRVGTQWRPRWPQEN